VGLRKRRSERDKLFHRGSGSTEFTRSEGKGKTADKETCETWGKDGKKRENLSGYLVRARCGGKETSARKYKKTVILGDKVHKVKRGTKECSRSWGPVDGKGLLKLGEKLNEERM